MAKSTFPRKQMILGFLVGLGILGTSALLMIWIITAWNLPTDLRLFVPAVCLYPFIMIFSYVMYRIFGLEKSEADRVKGRRQWILLSASVLLVLLYFPAADLLLIRYFPTMDNGDRSLIMVLFLVFLFVAFSLLFGRRKHP
jgi:hypothetical protein